MGGEKHATPEQHELAHLLSEIDSSHDFIISIILAIPTPEGVTEMINFIKKNHPDKVTVNHKACEIRRRTIPIDE